MISKNLQPQSTSEKKKKIRQTQTKGHSTKYLTSNSRNCQSHEKQGESETCHGLEGTKI